MHRHHIHPANNQIFKLNQLNRMRNLKCIRLKT